MDEKNPDRPLPDEQELMGLVELQKFLADELSQTDPDAHFDRSFLPLTSGLGLGTTPKREGARPTRSPGEMRQEPTLPGVTREPLPAAMRPPVTFVRPEQVPKIADSKPPVQKTRREPARDDDEGEDETISTEALLEKLRKMPAPQTRRSAQTLPESKGLRKVIEPDSKVVPPPVPQVTGFRRLCAGLMDQVFVLSVLAVAIFITAQMVGPMGATMGLADLMRPVVIRLAALEFATLWLCYLSVCLGVMDMTFGMWIWGIRVSYPADVSASRFLRKVMRIFCSFLFFAPILPSVLLIFRFRGRTLLDVLTGTRLYRSGI